MAAACYTPVHWPARLKIRDSGSIILFKGPASRNLIPHLPGHLVSFTAFQQYQRGNQAFVTQAFGEHFRLKLQQVSCFILYQSFVKSMVSDSLFRVAKSQLTFKYKMTFPRPRSPPGFFSISIAFPISLVIILSGLQNSAEKILNKWYMPHSSLKQTKSNSLHSNFLHQHSPTD